ncbi:MAG: hypothetical protein AABM29_07860 [Actinomycetota bacterium]
MRRRVLGWASLLAVLTALVVVGEGGSGASAQPGDVGAIRGHPRTGSAGIKVSVADIIARGRKRDRITGPPQGLRPAPEPTEPGGQPSPAEEPGAGEGPRPDIGPRAGEELGSGEKAEEEEREAAPPKIPGAPSLQAPQRAPIRRASGPSSPFAVSTSFLGTQSSESGFIPPDTQGSVGPTQVVFASNGRIKVFDKQGSAGALNVSDETFFSSVCNCGPTVGVSDPEVEYDRLSGRWIIAEINVPDSGSNRVMVAVSSGSTITAQTDFTFYFFNASAGKFADYPQMGVDNNAIYIGVNNFVGSPYVGSDAFVIRKSSVLSGGPIVVTTFPVVPTAGSGGPYTPQGVTSVQGPTATQGYFIGVDNQAFSQLDVRRVSDPGGTPTMSGNLTISVPTTYFPLNVPAQGTSTSLDALDDRLFEAMISRKPNGTFSLWTAHNIRVNSSGVGGSAGNRDAARWYEVSNLSTTPSLVQSGTEFDTAATNPRFFWIPTIAANGQGHASLNSSTAGVGRFTEVALMGRLATDPLGATQPFTIPFSNTFAYNVTVTDPQRWGDYTQTVVDPNDNQTFWTFQEYANATNSWGVRVFKLLAPPPATPSSGSPLNVPQGSASTSVAVSGTAAAGSGFFDPGPDTGGPGYANHIQASVNGGVTVNSITFTDPTHVTLDLDTTAAAVGPKSVTVTNPDGQIATGTCVFNVGSDSTSPDTTIDSGPPATTTSTSPDFTFSSTEPACGTFQCQLDGAGFSSCTSPKSFSGLAPGTHLFEVKAVDSFGNEDPTPAQSTFTIVSSGGGGGGGAGGAGDTAPPDTRIKKHPKKSTDKDKARFRFSSTEPGSSFQCKLDRKPFKPCKSPKKYGNLKPGRHKFKVRAIDAASNVDPSVARFKWQVTD